ncbi:very-long-chain enoyl-CoA reductase [Acrasis kona]|uniref:very-long-chain enoyl-CoA reductase n=1 Tax=Acrasis kona TaxID=1008807 RepID=A0AAW2ZAQ7_9EUKA
MKVSVVSQSGRAITDLDIPEKATYTELKEAYKQKKGLDVHRQQFYLRNEDKSRGEPLKHGALTLGEGQTLVFKDLGPQISWTTVFLVEYFGSLIAFPVVYLLRDYIYSKGSPLGDVQLLAAALFTLHFLKRELETLFVHKFGTDTMPIFNIFKNSSYYHGFAFYIAYYILHPLYTPPNKVQVIVGAAIFLVCLVCNFYCHIILSNLRAPGSRERKIPRGFLFELVSCPNYFFEITQWVGFSIMTQSLPALFFALAGAGQMLVWAQGKHRRYKKEFPDYPKRRRVLIPYIL